MSMENIAGARKPAKREDERTVAGEHRMMRRADREVTDPEQIAAIIAACDIVEVAYADAEGLAIVPLNFGFDYEYDEADGVAATALVNGAETVGSTGVVAADGGVPRQTDALVPFRAARPQARRDSCRSRRASARGIHHAGRLRGGGGSHHVQLGRGVQVDCRQWRGLAGQGFGRMPPRLAGADGAAGAHAARRIHRRAGAQRHSVEDRGRLLHHQGPCQARARAHASAPCRAARRCDRCPITSLQQGWDVGCGAAQRFLTYRVPRPAPSLVMVPLSSSVFSVRSTVLALISGNC